MVYTYGIRNCDTCKKALQWLKERGIDRPLRDFRKGGLDRENLARWRTRISDNRLINRRGTTWRQLPDDRKAQADGEGVTELLVENPTLIKRPVFEFEDGTVLVGFDDAIRAALDEKLSGQHRTD